MCYINADKEAAKKFDAILPFNNPVIKEFEHPIHQMKLSESPFNVIRCRCYSRSTILETCKILKWQLDLKHDHGFRIS